MIDIPSPLFIAVAAATQCFVIRLSILPLLRSAAPCGSLWRRLPSELHKQQAFANHVVSLVHASVCATLVTLAFATDAMLPFHLIDTTNATCRLTLALSTGYFVYDSIDMARCGMARRDWGIWVHHAVVVLCFGSALIDGRFAGYLCATLIVEWYVVAR